MSGTERNVWPEDRGTVSPWTGEGIASSWTGEGTASTWAGEGTENRQAGRAEAVPARERAIEDGETIAAAGKEIRAGQEGPAGERDVAGASFRQVEPLKAYAAVPGAEGTAGEVGSGIGAVHAGSGMAGAGRSGFPDGPSGAPWQGKPTVRETEETRRLKENFGLIAPAALIYAFFYVLCMYRNGSGITFPFFVGGSLIFLRFSSSRLGITLKKGSAWYMAAMLLLGLSTFCTDDGRIIFFNKLGVFLLTMSLLLKQYFDTSKWKLGKYLGSICRLVFASLGELGRPFSDGAFYEKSRKRRTDRRGWYVALGLLVGAPLLLAVLLLLASADAIFGQMAYALLETINPINLFRILWRISIVFFASYALTAYLCKKQIREEVTDRRKGEPALAITVTGLLTAVYLLFCGVQIGGLFLGRLQLPQGYTYAMYAREGFFQLLAVSSLNLAIVLVCMSYFRESRVLKWIMTVMSLCTFVMIASSAMRMIIYIRYYYLTFLRILVLWGLGLLAVLFVGVAVSIWREDFPLFRYGMGAVAVLYLALSFAHPDYLIARVNVANAPDAALQGDGVRGQGFFLAEEPYGDYGYLMQLSADAAPVLVPYLEGLGYHMEAFWETSPVRYAIETGEAYGDTDNPLSGQRTFGYCWMDRLKMRTEGMDLRTFNLSRHLALRCLEGK